MPPKEGIAIGTMISEPFPVEVSTGISAMMVVAAVIMAGLTLLLPASITDALTSFNVLGFLFSKTWFR